MDSSLPIVCEIHHAIIMDMDAATLASLNRINEEFYQTFASSFSSTRHKVQPGVMKILENLPREGRWLDIGCGNGNLADAWRRSGRKGAYVGLDFSEGLIQDAEYAGKDAGPEQTIQFFMADVTQNEWAAQLPVFEWSGIFCFAVLHHIPGNGQRRALCAQMRGLLTENSSVYISVWQPLNSPRLMRRIQPWNAVGIEDRAVDAGDILMEWRAHISGLEEAPALRYVHVFSEEELSSLAVDSGLKATETFYSDGKEGNLALYQKWSPVF